MQPLIWNISKHIRNTNHIQNTAVFLAVDLGCDWKTGKLCGEIPDQDGLKWAQKNLDITLLKTHTIRHPICPDIKTLMLHSIAAVPTWWLSSSCQLLVLHTWLNPALWHPYLTGFIYVRKQQGLFSAGIWSFKVSLVWFRLYLLHVCFLQISLWTYLLLQIMEEKY